MLLELCTLDDVLAYPGMSGVSDQDAPWLVQLVRGFSQRAESWTDRWLHRESRTEYFNTGVYQCALQLKAFGHSASTITTVHEDFSRVFGASTLVAATGYRFDYLTGMLTRDYQSWFSGRGVVRVVYDGGLGLTTEDVPADLRMAATMQCAFW